MSPTALSSSMIVFVVVLGLFPDPSDSINLNLPRYLFRKLMYRLHDKVGDKCDMNFLRTLFIWVAGSFGSTWTDAVDDTALATATSLTDTSALHGFVAFSRSSQRFDVLSEAVSVRQSHHSAEYVGHWNEEVVESAKQM